MNYSNEQLKAIGGFIKELAGWAHAETSALDTQAKELTPKMDKATNTQERVEVLCEAAELKGKASALLELESKLLAKLQEMLNEEKQ